MHPFRKSTKDLANKQKIRKVSRFAKQNITAVVASAMVSKGTGLKISVSPSSNASAKQSIPLLAVKIDLMMTSFIARCSNAPFGSARFIL